MPSLAAAAAGLAGLALGAFVIRSPQVSPAAESISRVAPPYQPGRLAAAAAAPGVAPTLPPEAGAAPAQAAAAKAVRSLAGPPAKAHAVSRPRTVLAKAAGHKRSVAVAQPASCEHNAKGAGCRRAVILADRHLRDVYERAVRRGVPRAVLIDYRDRWADLRESDGDDPVRLIENYGALAYDLGREARDNDEGALRRRNRSGFKALADALLPWW